MLMTIFIIALVGAYCAIVLFGHILLLIALWPGLFSRRQAKVGSIPPATAQPASPVGWSGGKLAA